MTRREEGNKERSLARGDPLQKEKDMHEQKGTAYEFRPS